MFIFEHIRKTDDFGGFFLDNIMKNKVGSVKYNFTLAFDCAFLFFVVNFDASNWNWWKARRMKGN